MKKPKSKTKLGNAPAVKPLALAHPSDSPYAGLPTPKELAVIAATLAGSSIKGSPVKAWTNQQTLDWAEENVWAAMRLWIISRKRINFAATTFEIQREDDDFENEIFPPDDEHFLPEPADEYPITRDQFLRVMLPKYKSRTAELARIAKAFVREVLLDRHQREPSADEIASAYGTWNLKPYENAKQANGAARKFEIWYAEYIKGIRRHAGLKSAAKKAALKKSRRSVKPPREK